jgi:serine/threonine-protein kinase
MPTVPRSVAFASSPRFLRLAACLASPFGLAFLAGPAFGQTSGHDPAAAQALFDQGKSLMQAQKFAEACPKLAESQRLDPGDGTLLLLAVCHESTGKTATAWAEFDEAAGLARADRRADREKVAIDHGRALEARLTKIRILVSGGPVEVRRDGAVVGEAQWSTPVPVDPGPHAIEASAPGKTTWKTTVSVEGEGRVIDVIIPNLVEAPGAPAPARASPHTPAPASASAPAPALASAPAPDTPNPGASWRLAAVVVGGAGLVAAGFGAGFGIDAESKWHTVESACPANRCLNQNGPDEGRQAGSEADASTILFAAGGVAVATAAVLLLAAPTAPVRVGPAIGAGTVGLTVGGAL